MEKTPVQNTTEPKSPGKPASEQKPAPENPNSASPAVIENFLDTYKTQAEWIRFADTKAGLILTVNAALISLIVPTLESPFDDGGIATLSVIQWITFSSFVIWFLFAALSGVWAFRCIAPFRKGRKHPALDTCPHFHPVGIAGKYKIAETERFIKEAEEVGTKGFKEQVLAGILIDAHVSDAKYIRVTRSIHLLGWSVIFGFGYLLMSQF